MISAQPCLGGLSLVNENDIDNEREREESTMATKLIGYKRFTSKKNVETCIASVVQDLSDRDRAGGSVGQRVDEIFMPHDQVDYLQPEHIGKELSFSYDMVSGTPYLSKVTVVK